MTPDIPEFPLKFFTIAGNCILKKPSLFQRKYEKAVEEARKTGWHRAMIFGQIWLALVAINLDLLPKAEVLLKEALPEVEKNGDRRCLAFCKRAFALLKKAQKNWQEAKYWAALAREDFRDLLMHREMAKMDEFL